ncbi:MAG: RNA 3'-terminal phosphate cyclase [Candidatus Pacearchaeota archaeon]
MDSMIEIDGSYGSGGGQIIRTALALSCLTGKAFHVSNIRAKRKNPGLAAQHLACVNSIAKLCNAEVKGNFLGSRELFFKPCKIEVKHLKIDIGTAGSIALVLQALMPALTISNPIELEIIGGTDVKMAPSIDYIREVLLRLLSKLDYKASLQIIRRGFFPKGGGKIIFKAEPMKLKEYRFTEQGKLVGIHGISIASQHLKKAKVAERQAEKAKKLLSKLNLPIEIKAQYAESYSPGSTITLWLETENSVLGACALGEQKKPAEKVAEEAAQSLIHELEKNAVVDVHAADQLLPYLALTGGSLKTSSISEHAKTNAFVIEKFLPVKFEIEEKKAEIKIKKDLEHHNI